MLNYVYLNSGLTINYNNEKYKSENGLKDLLEKNTENQNISYPIILCVIFVYKMFSSLFIIMSPSRL